MVTLSRILRGWGERLPGMFRIDSSHLNDSALQEMAALTTVDTIEARLIGRYDHQVWRFLP